VGDVPAAEEWREIDDVTVTEYTVRGLTAFTVYELRVSAVNSIGRSQPSTSVDVTTAELGMKRFIDLAARQRNYKPPLSPGLSHYRTNVVVYLVFSSDHTCMG